MLPAGQARGQVEANPAEQLRAILRACDDTQRADLMKMLRSEFPTHDIEREWNTSAEVILEALARSEPLTKRMFKGILAEAACKIEVIDKLDGWRDVTPTGGNFAYDFVVERDGVRVTIQAKLQRKSKHEPMAYKIKGRRGHVSGFYVVETQKTRAGNKKTGEKTRPYSFGEFDILAVSMEPATRDWSQFRFTVGNWLLPRLVTPTLMAVLQPVALVPDEDWTDSLPTAIEWWRSGAKKSISVERAARDSGPPADVG